MVPSNQDGASKARSKLSINQPNTLESRTLAINQNEAKLPQRNEVFYTVDRAQPLSSLESKTKLRI